MWTPLLNIQTPTAGINSAITVISVDPWQGLSQSLTFPNAVKNVISRLQLQPTDAVFAIAIAAPNLSAFSAALSLFNAVFPVPMFERLKRRSDNQATHETTKMQLVAPKSPPSALNMNSLPSVREALRKSLVDESKQFTDALKSANPLTNIADFNIAKLARQAAAAAIPALPTSVSLPSGTAWRFYAETDILSQLAQNHPGDNYGMTVIICFIAPPAELAALVGLFQ